MTFIRQQQEAISDLFTHAFEYNASNGVLYKGDAAAGASKAGLVWRISKFTYDANQSVTDIQWASGTADFQFAWDSRATYTYT